MWVADAPSPPRFTVYATPAPPGPKTVSRSVCRSNTCRLSPGSTCTADTMANSPGPSPLRPICRTTCPWGESTVTVGFPQSATYTCPRESTSTPRTYVIGTDSPVRNTSVSVTRACARSSADGSSPAAAFPAGAASGRQADTASAIAAKAGRMMERRRAGMRHGGMENLPWMSCGCLARTSHAESDVSRNLSPDPKNTRISHPEEAASQVLASAGSGAATEGPCRQNVGPDLSPGACHTQGARRSFGRA